ncbi:PREDICTED: uncharacterized protein LOC107358730 [Acropora digitifera]|uniref:uncharacterized protein LOC107358730 n=1 Tax=Acropora digitifera TaxID=70779 RepID=UPI00077AD65E|nr:PREDICTED: uncharacterized protein LOC107358730 [Acropora digitifera]
MAEDVAKAAAEVSTNAVMDLSLCTGAFSISLKIDNVWLAGAVTLGALSLGAFYLSRKGPTEEAIRRALERNILDATDPRVINITDGHSILTELHCNSETSFLIFLDDFENNTVKFRLEEELKKIGFKSDLDVTIQNKETVDKQVSHTRGRCSTGKETGKAVIWQRNHKDLGKHEEERLNKPEDIEKLSKELQRIGNELDEIWFERATGNSSRELEFIKERLQRELAISRGLRKTTEKLQEEKKRLETTRRSMEHDVLELRETVHELEKTNQSFQQKLKRTEKEIERLQLKEIDDVIPETRPRSPSGTSLGASSGYQSEEDPGESTLEIIQMPRSQVIQEGKKLVLSCHTRGLSDMRYRWVKDDVEIPGANRPDLVLEPVRMHDFGMYFCRVWDKSGSVTSLAADIDVFPRTNKRFKGLHELNEETKQAFIDLLSKKRLPGLATWKQVARRYGMRETEISLLDKEKVPAAALFQNLLSLGPNLTVYYLCKTFKEAGLKRLDCIDLLSQEMVTSI